MTPEIHYAQNEGVNIAYQVFGDGPQDLIIIPGLWSNLDVFWEEPRVARFFLDLARYVRFLIHKGLLVASRSRTIILKLNPELPLGTQAV